MSGDLKRNYGVNCETGKGESRRQTVQPRSRRSPRQSSTLLARWLRAHGIEAYVIHAMSIAVSREHRRAKTMMLQDESLMVSLSLFCRIIYPKSLQLFGNVL